MPYFSDQEARSIIRDTYSKVRSDGTAVAEAFYAHDELAGMPAEAVALALGVGHPVRHAALRTGESVLDLGCGAGIDTLLAASAVGPFGRVVGLDMTPEMAARVRRNAATGGFDHVEIRVGLIEEPPVPDSSMDVVISNGVLNLTPDKDRAFGEIFRILKPGGQFLYGDIIVATELSELIRRNIDLWTG